MVTKSEENLQASPRHSLKWSKREITRILCCTRNMTLDFRRRDCREVMNTIKEWRWWRRTGRMRILRNWLEIVKVSWYKTLISHLIRHLPFPVEINLDEMKSEWEKTAGPLHIRRIAHHYGIYEHLFGHHAYFTPRVPLSIKVSWS